LSFPLGHLWFPYVLTLMYATALAVRQGVVERISRLVIAASRYLKELPPEKR
jgi:hypothetical protein